MIVNIEKLADIYNKDRFIEIMNKIYNIHKDINYEKIGIIALRTNKMNNEIIEWIMYNIRNRYKDKAIKIAEKYDIKIYEKLEIDHNKEDLICIIY